MEPTLLTAPLESSASCPRCQVPLEAVSGVNRCGGCQGSWVPEALVHERVTAARGRRSHLTWNLEQREPLPCAACAAPMETIRVKKISLDRCARHGIWFDADELPRMLELAAASAPPRRPAGAVVPVTTAVATAAVAAAVAEEARAADDEGAGLELVGDVAEATLDVVSDSGFLEGLLDVISGLFD